MSFYCYEKLLVIISALIGFCSAAVAIAISIKKNRKLKGIFCGTVVFWMIHMFSSAAYFLISDLFKFDFSVFDFETIWNLMFSMPWGICISVLAFEKIAKGSTRYLTFLKLNCIFGTTAVAAHLVIELVFVHSFAIAATAMSLAVSIYFCVLVFRESDNECERFD